MHLAQGLHLERRCPRVSGVVALTLAVSKARLAIHWHRSIAIYIVLRMDVV